MTLTIAEKLLNELNESGYPRLLQIMAGVVPTVKTFGIITAENPMGVDFPKKENANRNDNLKKMLNRGHYGYNQVKGMYGFLENPFFVRNITRGAIEQYGKDFDQKAVIWGEVKSHMVLKDETVKTPADVTIYYLGDRDYLKDDFKVGSSRHIFQYIGKEATDFYSEYKGRKFIIPFFDDSKENIESILSAPKESAEKWIMKNKLLKHKNIVLIEKALNISLDEHRVSMHYSQRGKIRLLLDEMLKDTQ